MEMLYESILKTVAYFDVFSYPVSRKEIRVFIDFSCNDDQLSIALNELVKDKIIFELNDYYSLINDYALIIKRIKENADAVNQQKNAKRAAAWLTRFPFVKGIAISGSLSKNIANENSDIDFFIITKANRLWISKLCLSFFIKFASLFGYGKWFCLNYIVDETYLEVEEKNIFTATEIATLMPVYGVQSFNRFFKANEWVYDFFPNLKIIANPVAEKSKPILRRLSEWLLKNKTGNKFDDTIMRYFDKRWAKMMKKSQYTQTGFQLGAMMVNKHYCRPFPEHFQQKILNRFQEKKENILKKNSVLELP